ncbi:unnamed protein product [Lymnaea stagnalis]|uniref:Uncharacterized protein n=1 Tax=Lymnaea stagnalis TaxID=6523 RepID=A0AAV2HAZ5_LYMST
MDETDLNSAIGHQEVNVIMLCIGVNDPQGVTRMELWVHKLKTLFTNSRLILVGTKCDLGRAPNSSALARAYDRTMADSQRTSAYVECSARTQYGISDLVKAVLEPAVTNVTPTFASKVMDLCLIQ